MSGLRSVVLIAVIALLATPVAASAATLHLKAPKKVDRAEAFRVVTKGKAKPRKHYYVSVIYHDSDQGRCEPTVTKEITRNKYFPIFFRRKIETDRDGRFELTSRKMVGGDQETSGKFCGYLTNRDDENKDTVVRRIKFT
jgi:hypothetical protein